MAGLEALINLNNQALPSPVETTQGAQFLNLANSIPGNSFAGAIAKGLAIGIGGNKTIEGSQKKLTAREKQLAQNENFKAIAENMMQQEQYIAQIEGMLKKSELASQIIAQNQKPIDEAVINFKTTGDIRNINTLATGDSQMRQLISDFLPDGVAFTELRKLGENQVAVIGIGADGKEVIGDVFDPMTIASPDGKTTVMELLGKQQDLNKTGTFLITDKEGNRQTVFGTEADVLKQASAQGGEVVGKIDAKADLTGGDIGFGTKATNDIESQLLDSTKSLQRLEGIRTSFKPEFLQIQTKAGVALDKLLEKGGVDLKPEEKTRLQEYTTFARRSAENINLYIKEITGAQMSEPEAVRLKKAAPDADADSPTEFKTKLEDVTRTAKFAVARLAHAKRKGLSLDVNELEKNVPLESMERIISDRGAEVIEEIRSQNPAITAEELRAQAARQTALEFGLLAGN